MIKKRNFQFLLAILFYLILTVFMTYPLTFRANNYVRDFGDSLLNTWILSTVADKIAGFKFKTFFSANIFYPEERPLLYSEILIPQAILALPIIKITKNPILAHNLILLIAFLTSALGMFFLAHYLTRQLWPALMAGLIFAFSPFMIAHTFQVQVISAAGLPLSFLFLHRYFQSGRFLDWLSFVLTYIVQSLANLYYALFMIIFCGIFIIIEVLDKKRYRQKDFWVHFLFFIFCFILILGPVFMAYAGQQAKAGFERTIGAQAVLVNYLATPRINRLYGEWSTRFRHPEGELFPGFLVFGLAMFCLISTVSILISSQFNQKYRGLGRNWRNNEENLSFKLVIFYFLILILGVLFSFGTKGPFYFWYHFVPGYKAIRAVSRFHIYTMLALAVLSAFGLDKLLFLIRKTSLKSFLVMVILGLIILEYLSIPMPLRRINGPEDMPQVYQELKRWPEKKVILELPLPEPGSGIARVEAPRMYYSLFHGHFLVNGYSGFFSPSYLQIREKLYRQSLEENICFWRELEINLIILHCAELAPEDCPKLIENLNKSGQLVLIGQFGRDFLFSLL
ncbi:MAG: hypothetical protein N3B16_08295 [Candidatus Aminicenantes bacterium]|nr:hypothetical protein [Candidatus Aminicenantes bacterium]